MFIILIISIIAMAWFVRATYVEHKNYIKRNKFDSIFD